MGLNGHHRPFPDVLMTKKLNCSDASDFSLTGSPLNFGLICFSEEGVPEGAELAG